MTDANARKKLPSSFKITKHAYSEEWFGFWTCKISTSNPRSYCLVIKGTLYCWTPFNYANVLPKDYVEKQIKESTVKELKNHWEDYAKKWWPELIKQQKKETT